MALYIYTSVVRLYDEWLKEGGMCNQKDISDKDKYIESCVPVAQPVDHLLEQVAKKQVYVFNTQRAQTLMKMYI